MKAGFEVYLADIGMTDHPDGVLLRQRIDTVLQFWESVCIDEQVKRIFMTDIVNEDGSVAYKNLWLFSDSFVMEATAFLSTDVIDLVVIKDNILQWVVRKQEYDFGETNAKSRLSVEFTLHGGLSGSLRASRQNCRHLKEVLVQYISANLTRNVARSKSSSSAPAE